MDLLKKLWLLNLDYSIDSNFQGAKKLFVLLLENNVLQTSYKQYFLPSVEIKDYNVMIKRIFFFLINQYKMI